MINLIWRKYLSQRFIAQKYLANIYFFSLKITKKHIINIPLTEGDCLSNFYRCPHQKGISIPLTTWIGAIYLLKFTKENLFSIIVKIQCTYNYVVKRKHSELNMYYSITCVCSPWEKKLKDVRNGYTYTYSFLKHTALPWLHRSVRIQVESCIIFILIYSLVYLCTLNLFRVVFNYICILSRPSEFFHSVIY